MAKKTTNFTKAALLNAIAASSILAPERVHIEELDGDVFAKRMTVGEREDYFNKMKALEDSNGLAEAFIFATVDADGERIFNDDDIDVVRTLPQEIVENVLEAFNRTNRLIVADDLKKAGETQEDVDLKNS